jgi:hypothetical protein
MKQGFDNGILGRQRKNMGVAHLSPGFKFPLSEAVDYHQNFAACSRTILDILGQKPAQELERFPGLNPWIALSIAKKSHPFFLTTNHCTRSVVAINGKSSVDSAIRQEIAFDGEPLV